MCMRKYLCKRKKKIKMYLFFSILKLRVRNPNFYIKSIINLIKFYYLFIMYKNRGLNLDELHKISKKTQKKYRKYCNCNI